MGVDKQAIRSRLRQQRKALAASAVRAASAAVCAQLGSLAVFQRAAAMAAYVATENEIDPTALIDAVAHSSRRLYLPRQLDAPAWIAWHPTEPLAPSRFGVPEPTSNRPATPEEPFLALVPLVAWDVHGTRVGRGAGFYDRLLSRSSRGSTHIGLAYEFQEVGVLPHDTWDVPLDYVITEKRVVRCEAAIKPEASRKGGGQWNMC